MFKYPVDFGAHFPSGEKSNAEFIAMCERDCTAEHNYWREALERLRMSDLVIEDLRAQIDVLNSRKPG